MQDRDISVKAGALILTAGYELFDAARKSEYGYGRHKSVVTSMQFERILSASGPYTGHLQRPGDHKVPGKIAWIQCVGSRDVTEGNPYCSSVCCMAATKQAIIAKEHEKNLHAAIFYIDIRAFGKGFEAFYKRAQQDYNVVFVRSQVSSLKENPINHNIIVRHVSPENQIVEQEYDMVVLSVGMTAAGPLKELAAASGISLNAYGFARTDPVNPLYSSREGIFLSGALTGPRDIPETVMQSSAAASLAGELLSAARNTETESRDYPEEKHAAGDKSRIGVFICHCGMNIASTVDVEKVTEYVSTLPDVVHAEHNLYTCSQDTQKRIREAIADNDLDRVIVASCSPRTHADLFQETMREAGLNKHLFEMTDIREQCSWVHQNNPRGATRKAGALIRGSVAKAKLLEPLKFKKVGVTRSGLVIGGGVSGMTAALSLARQDYTVHLVEKERGLGGNLVNIRKSLEGCDWHGYLEKLVMEVQSHENIRVYLETEIDTVSGYIGNFSTTLRGACSNQVNHGVIIVAAGARELKPGAFLYGKNEGVLTQKELERSLESGFSAQKIVMIQCVGSRREDRPYCSRVCCGQAVKNALSIKNLNPQADVYILYRDIRTYGYKEEYYYEAREKGVKFIRFADEDYPGISENGQRIHVKVMDGLLKERVEIDTDLLVLSPAVVPDLDNNRRIAELLKIPLNEDGFFMEAHIKLRPVDFANEGIFVCGLAHSPKYTEENITQALAAAGRAACILSRDTLEVGGVVSVVDQDKCAVCLTCVRECVYQAPFINNDLKAEIEAAKCQGCGNCAAACPACAIQLQTFTDDQQHALTKSILTEEVNPKQIQISN
jgi:heterodisulfide reductase subunit A